MPRVATTIGPRPRLGLPTRIARLNVVRNWLDSLPPETRVLDADCGEGALVETESRRGGVQAGHW